MEDPDEFLNVSLLNFDGDVDEQITALLEHVRLSRGDVVSLRNLLADLEHALRNIWPGCEVQPFGSIITGLGIKSSDVDVYVRIPRSQFYKCNPVILARNALRTAPWLFTKIFAITTAKVPIVKFLHVPTGCNCDVNFKSESGVRNSKLIFHFLKTDSKALSLAIVVKYWSKVFKLTGTNLMPNYALTMLVIFYMQGINMLAPVKGIQKSMEPYMIDGWNTAIDYEAAHPKAYNGNIYHLIGGFFKYYSLFKFNLYVVSTYLGIPVLRSSFVNLDQGLHKEFSVYKENLRTEFCKPLKIDSLMCIQDPFDHSRNCASAINQKLFARIQILFQHAARMYEQMAPNDFLKAVLSQDPQIRTSVPSETTHKHTIHTITKNNTHQKKKKIKNIAIKYIEMRRWSNRNNKIR